MLLRPQHTIGANEVHVWHVLADGIAGHEAHQALHPLLSGDERRRMNDLRHERDRMLYLLSRGLMRSVLASYVGCACGDLQFTANPFGKPILRTEGGPPAVNFNLTHSRGAVVLALSRERDVGVDIEEHQRRVDYLGLAQRYFADLEARYLESLDDPHRGAAFFALWTLKEAYVKGIGRGLTFPLDAFAFELDVNRLRAFRPLADFVASDWHFHQFDLGDRHCGALAVQGTGVHIEMRDWAAAFVNRHPDSPRPT